MSNYQDQQIVIIGLGATGLSCVDFLLQQGAMPRVMDTRAHPPGLTQLPQGVTVHLGSLRVDWLLEADLIVLSPGVFSKLPELQQAMTAGVEIIGDIELFCRHVSAPVVAITGSNGKSTVTMLLGQMVQAAGIKVAVGGNLGPPALTLLHPSIELYILELSSFQLESTFSLRATVATILNLTPDHHDRYPEGIAIYTAAKQRIYQQAQCILFNADDPATQPLHVPQQTACISFGLADADYALIEHQQALWLAAHGEPVLAADALKLLGCHNQMNALAALALADVLAIPRSASLTGLHKFTGLAHRLQRIWQHRGIDWINDSKATNVGSTVAALSGLNIKGHLHLLLGGEGKGADFSPLKAYLQGNHLSLYCFGQVGSQLAALRPEIAECSTTLAQAMQIIAARVKPGDTVLLSPACASFDQFNSFEQRGALFTQLAKALG